MLEGYNCNVCAYNDVCGCGSVCDRFLSTIDCTDTDVYEQDLQIRNNIGLLTAKEQENI